MQSQQRKLKRILSGQQNQSPISSKVGGNDEQVVTLKKGKFLPKKAFDKLSDDDKVIATRNRNKIYTKRIIHS